MKNEMKNKIIIRPQTVDEEFDYLMKVLGKMDFYNEHGYPIPIPDHPYFLNLSNNLDLLETLDMSEAREIFKQEVYSLDFFKNGLAIINKDILMIKKAINTMIVWESWGFKMFPVYEVRLTAYGPGGSYNYKEGNIIMKTKRDGGFGKRTPLSTVIHEIIHIGIEDPVIQKIKLTHIEKEGLVDAICFNYFSDILTSYEPQELGDKKVFNLISKDNIMELPKIIKEYKKI